MAGDRFRRVSNLTVRPSFNFDGVRWLADGKHVVFKVQPSSMLVDHRARKTTGMSGRDEVDGSATDASPGVTVYSSERVRDALSVVPNQGVNTQGFESRRSDLIVGDVNSGVDETVAAGVTFSSYWVSPDGQYLAYTNLKGIQSNSQQDVYELVLFTLATKKKLVLVPQIFLDFGLSVSWSPDSRSLAYITSGQLARGDCYVVSIGDGHVVNLTPGIHISFVNEYGGPIWDRRSDAVYLTSSDEHSGATAAKIWRASVEGKGATEVVALANHVLLGVVVPASEAPVVSSDADEMTIVATREEISKKFELYKVSLASGRAVKIFEKDGFLDDPFHFGFSRDGKTLVYAFQDAQHPEDVWSLDSGGGRPRQLTRLNPQLDHVVFGESRLIEWRSIDGDRVRGALLLPSNYRPGEKYPLIVKVYGGASLSNDVYRFGLLGPTIENLQLFSTRSYAVLVPDGPVGKHAPMPGLLNAILPGVDKVVELGFAEPNHIGLMGLSYGGYSTLSLIVQTKRFKAAVAIAGVVDLVSVYGHLDDGGSSGMVGWAETGQGAMGGSLWQFRERYIENSPVFFLDRVETPLLLVHGDRDRSVPCQQSEEVFVGLRRLGKEVVYAKYAGEPHGYDEWTYAHQVDYLERIIEWFDGHLKN
jgi:dipeptidyl aminopeptidase/acylaminoacyl peptidase